MECGASGTLSTGRLDAPPSTPESIPTFAARSFRTAYAGERLPPKGNAAVPKRRRRFHEKRKPSAFSVSAE